MSYFFSSFPKNWSGAFAFSVRECRRFLRVWMQTIGAPLVSSLLYFLIFGAALGAHIPFREDISYFLFLIPGIVAMNMISHAFQNTSSAIIIRKFQGTMASDMLALPLSPVQIVLGNMLGAMVRGILVGGSILLLARCFLPFGVEYPWLLLFSSLAMTGIFGLLGVAIGLWSKDFDGVSAALNFFLTPLMYLGGVFFSLDMLPEPFQAIAVWNPLFFLIDLFRFSLLGVSEGSPLFSALVIGLFWIFLFLGVSHIFRKGIRLYS